MEKLSIGEKIRKVRKDHKDTLKQLAEKIDYDLSNLSKVERGKYGVSIELLKKVTKVYNLSPDYFFGDFTEAESDLLLEENMQLSDLKEKYNFTVDNVAATDEEIIEAIRLIRYLRLTK